MLFTASFQLDHHRSKTRIPIWPVPKTVLIYNARTKGRRENSLDAIREKKAWQIYIKHGWAWELHTSGLPKWTSASCCFGWKICNVSKISRTLWCAMGPLQRSVERRTDPSLTDIDNCLWSTDNRWQCPRISGGFTGCVERISGCTSQYQAEVVLPMVTFWHSCIIM